MYFNFQRKVLDPYYIHSLHDYFDNYKRTQFEHIILHVRTQFVHYDHMDPIRTKCKTYIIFGYNSDALVGGWGMRKWTYIV